MQKAEIKADKLVPLVLHFAQEFLDKKDFKKLKKNFDDDVELEDDLFVKETGGIRGLLESFLENNEDKAEKLLGIKGDKKEKKKKREEKADKKESKAKHARATRSRTSSLEWKPSEIKVYKTLVVKHKF